MHIQSLALRFLAILAVVTVLCPESRAAADPSALVAAFGARIRQVLADGSLTPAERQERFHSLLDQGVDFPRISCFVLGRYWPGASDSYRREFTRVFEDYVAQSLSARLAIYNGDWMNVTGTHAEGEHSTVVSTIIVYPSGDPVARVDWRLRNTPDGLKIEDVSDSGVSMAVTYREEFASVIAYNGGQISTLIPAMRQKLDRQEASYSTAGMTRTDAGNIQSDECAP